MEGIYTFADEVGVLGGEFSSIVTQRGRFRCVLDTKGSVPLCTLKVSKFNYRIFVFIVFDAAKLLLTYERIVRNLEYLSFIS